MNRQLEPKLQVAYVFSKLEEIIINLALSKAK